jgi:hypothetical protein
MPSQYRATTLKIKLNAQLMYAKLQASVMQASGTLMQASGTNMQASGTINHQTIMLQQQYKHQTIKHQTIMLEQYKHQTIRAKLQIIMLKILH